jgi:hypothetical protein
MSWTEQQIQSVWNTGQVVDRSNPEKWRKDACGAWISRDQYGDGHSRFGWEIDRILPAEGGGTDDLSNLRPLHWKNALSRKDGRLTCLVTACGGVNSQFD